MRVLLVEDYVPIQKSVSRGLREAGFAVDVTGHGEEGLWYAMSNDYDVIILDLMLPGMDGLTILQRLRSGGRGAHVLILTAKDTVSDRIRGLDLGADDYLVKPFAFEELLARVRSLARRAYCTKNPRLKIKDLQIETTTQRVWRGKEQLVLTPREYALLEYLAMRTDEVVTPDRHLGTRLSVQFRSRLQCRECVYRLSPAEDRASRQGDADPNASGQRVLLGEFRMTRSIKARLLLWMSGGMAILLAIFAIVVYEVLSRSLTSGFDAVLASTVRTMQSSIEQDGARINVEFDERQLPEFYRTARPDYFQLRTENGQTVACSPSLKGANLDRFEAPLGSFTFRSVRLPDGRSGRAVALFFTPKVDEGARSGAPPQRLTLTVARETTALDSQIRLLQVLLGAATGGTIILAVLVGTVVMCRGLRPLETLASQIAAIGHDDLSTRIQVDPMPAEIVPVVHRLNDLLRRLEKAFYRERAFTADAAHELRTPLAGLRSVLEVALARPRVSQDYQQAMTECLDIVRHTHAMVEHLLALARLESGQTTLHHEKLYLGELLETAWRALVDQAQARRISLVRRVAENLACITDRDNLLIAMSILLTNAVDYTNDEGRIEVVAEHSAESVKLTVANTGCHLSKEEALHVFERFWRGDASRTDTGIHCGLGLSLARRIVTSLGGSIAADATGDIFAVRVVLPAALAT